MYANINPGDKFGKLTVIKCVGYPAYVKSRINYYLCQCECGKQKEIRRNHLLAKKTISCGCVQKTHAMKAPGESTKQCLFNVTKHGAKARQLEFSLTRLEHDALIAQNCEYCGEPPHSANNKIRKNGTIIGNPIDAERATVLANGIDRKNSAIGYTTDNCVACCANCNRAKWELSITEFIAHCKKVAAFNE